MCGCVCVCVSVHKYPLNIIGTILQFLFNDHEHVFGVSDIRTDAM